MASISGLSSGLDSAGIIDQLMQLEAAPQSRLKSRVASEQSVITSMQTLNTRVVTLQGKATALTKATAWSPLSATSSATSIKVTTAAGAAPASFSVNVLSQARVHQLGFQSAAALTDVVTGASTSVKLDRFDGSPVTLDTGDGTLAGLVSAINNPANATGLRASTIQVAGGSYRLMVESVATGAAQDFDLTKLDGSPLLGGATVVAGSDASLDLGAGIVATSTSNTFTDLLPGTTVTLGDGATVGTTSRITVSRDTAAVTAAMKDLVDTVNSVLTSIDTQSAYNATTKTAGPLSGESAVRALRTELLNSVYPTDGSSLAGSGLQVARDGTLKLDTAAFEAAYLADPAGVTEKFGNVTDGLAARVAAVAKSSSDSAKGTLTAAIIGRRDGVTRLQDSVADWDTRLELRRTTLQRQFTALETALNQMQSQSSWLAGQLGSLPSAGG
ncbi:flagellar filament capping protein FliD [Nocardioides rubriscoriae]|uniref:flagellar filament capping protein FliD n=1 Tax=Nocardioides rubriscoriae TaxID=642762 RepID=UPI0011DFAD99|nr:flagellar filament capping protein FliD [Nocardioides rubriscoriae]